MVNARDLEQSVSTFRTLTVYNTGDGYWLIPKENWSYVLRGDKCDVIISAPQQKSVLISLDKRSVRTLRRIKQTGALALSVDRGAIVLQSGV